MEGSISEEIIRLCLSFLEAEDLSILARVNSNWNRLTKDPSLWKSLYLSTFITSRSAGGIGSESVVNRSRPWRDLYKISVNWRRGNVRASTTSIRAAVLEPVPSDFILQGTESRSIIEDVVTEGRKKEMDTLLQFYKNWLFTASRTLSDSTNGPVISVHQTLSSGQSVLVGTISSTSIFSTTTITELRLDESPSTLSSTSLRLAAFYSSGRFSVFNIQLPTTSASFKTTELYLSPLEVIPRNPIDPIVLAKLYGPLLVTCSSSFSVRFWRIKESKSVEGQVGGIRVEGSSQTLQSRETWWPVVLSLSPIVAPAVLDEQLDEWSSSDFTSSNSSKLLPTQFKVTLAYSTPVFPSSFSVGVQEFNITIPASTSSSSYLNITTQNALAPSNQQAYFSPSSSSSRRRVPSPITSIEFSHPFIVTSRSDNIIEVFKLYYSTPTTSNNTGRNGKKLEEPRLKLKHHKTLFGHSSAVESIALESTASVSSVTSHNTTSSNLIGGGRCVSGGIDGVVKVWDLSLGSNDSDEDDQMGSFNDSATSDSKGKGKEMININEEEEEDDPASSIPSSSPSPPTNDWQSLLAEYSTSKINTSSNSSHRKRRIRKVWFDEEKIVSLVLEDDGVERVRVLRFD